MHALKPELPIVTAPATAVVVGLCAHGLAVTRALAKSGVPVVALEANRALPGFRTRHADVRHVPDINGTGLIEALQDLRQALPAEPDPVLILTNDNMVRGVGRHWDRLAGLYRLSWADCRDRVLDLLDKASLEAHCQTHDLPYPQSGLLARIDDIDALEQTGLSFPLIVKPTRPLSGFKVRLIDHRADLETLATDYAHALPFLVQRHIPGDDRRILFVAFYLDKGRVLATFCGRKLASHPPAMGQTTIAESYVHEQARLLSERFFQPLGLSGPVSLEVKLDAENRPWIIEPTLGRTDYWLDCCVANGVNLPLLEYRHQCDIPINPPLQTAGVIWFDTERRPLSYLGLRLNGGETATKPWKARFAYWDRTDPAPFRRAVVRLTRRTAGKVANRLRRVMNRFPL